VVLAKHTTENKDVQYSVDGTNWTTAFNTGTFTQGIQVYGVYFVARYIRIVSVNDLFGSY